MWADTEKWNYLAKWEQPEAEEIILNNDNLGESVTISYQFALCCTVHRSLLDGLFLSVAIKNEWWQTLSKWNKSGRFSKRIKSVIYYGYSLYAHYDSCTGTFISPMVDNIITWSVKMEWQNFSVQKAYLRTAKLYCVLVILLKIPLGGKQESQ